ncbi:hypothetical protein D3C84_937210 [compost metagenome]
MPGTGIGAVQPQRQAGIRQRPVVLLAQTCRGGDVGVGQVQLQPLGTQGLQLRGKFVAQLPGEGFARGLRVAPEQVDDFFHGDQVPSQLFNERAGYRLEAMLGSKQSNGILRTDY